MNDKGMNQGSGSRKGEKGPSYKKHDGSTISGTWQLF